MRSHGARCRRGSSWPTTTSTRAAAGRAALSRASERTWSRRPAASAGAASSARRGSGDGKQAAGDEQAPREAAWRDAREGSEQDDRQHGGTLGAGACGEGANRPGKGRAIRAYVRRDPLRTMPPRRRRARFESRRRPQPTRLAMLNRLTDSLDFQAQALQLRSERQRLIASNIANADTPGYIARDMDFAKALKAATGACRRPARSRRATPATSARGAAGSSGDRLAARAALRDAGADQPRPQHRRHGPRARQLRRQRGQVRGDAALHQRATCATCCRRSPSQ